MAISSNRLALDSRRAIGAPTPRRGRLAACLAAACGLGGIAETCAASTLVVNDCTDPLTKPPVGHVTLRSAVVAANNDATIGTIDASACSTITLAAGEIAITASSLKFLGQTKLNPGILTVDANYKSRVFNHGGTGTIEFDQVKITGGKIPRTGSNPGGCLSSAGSVILRSSSVTHCEAASGGGVAAQDSIRAYDSVIGYNFATDRGGLLVTGSQGYARLDSSVLSHNLTYSSCGGVTATTVTMTDGVVSGNAAFYTRQGYSYTYRYGSGGGICAANITLTRTSVSGNVAYYTGAALTNVLASGPATSVTLVDSTIDGNSGGGQVVDAGTLLATNTTMSGNAAGYAAISAAMLTLRNCTIAFNTSGFAPTNSYHGIRTTSAVIESSILARNVPDDLYVSGNGAAVSATHSLIMSANVATGSLSADPRLTPLAFHGGTTRTHALLATSPAIDQGSNGQALPDDQRGAGFPREVPSGLPDIGAYERQAQDDEIFYSGSDP